MSTILDVARLAGVSTATVSRVINSPGSVREETRERVTLAIRITSYNVCYTKLLRECSSYKTSGSPLAAESVCVESGLLRLLPLRCLSHRLLRYP